MAGTKEGGIKAAQKNIANNPNFYAEIGAKGGRNGHTGGFAAYIPCDCNLVAGNHHIAQCAGLKGGVKSRRTKREVANVR